MPEIGELCRIKKHLHIWFACPMCGKERWVPYLVHKQEPVSKRCWQCAVKGENGDHWKGGFYYEDGYKLVRVSSDSFFYPMNRGNGYIPEHRLIMAKHLGRLLHSWEIVHHKNGNKSDNRIENLELSSKGTHALAHSRGYKDGYQRGLHDGRDVRIRKLKELLNTNGIQYD